MVRAFSKIFTSSKRGILVSNSFVENDSCSQRSTLISSRNLVGNSSKFSSAIVSFLPVNLSKVSS